MNQQQTDTPQSKRDIEENKDIAALSYLWILSIIIYFARDDSPFIRFHARQGIVLFLISIPLALIPVIGNFLLLIVFAGMIMGFLNAFHGQKTDVLLAGKLSRGEMTIGQAWKEIWVPCKKFLRTIFPPKKKAPDTSPSDVTDNSSTHST